MKFTEPWGRQRLSFLLEKAASREAKMWKVYVPKKPSSQVSTDVCVPPFFLSVVLTKHISTKDPSGVAVLSVIVPFEQLQPHRLT